MDRGLRLTQIRATPPTKPDINLGFLPPSSDGREVLIGFRHLLLTLAVGARLLGDTPFESLYRLTHPTFRVHAHRAPFPSDLVSALAMDKEGCVWAGTVAGLARYDGRGWQPVETPLPSWRLWVNTNALGVLDDGTLWCGTRTEGLLFHKDGRWTRVSKEQGLPSPAINCLWESRARDKAGRRILYVGTYGGGIARLRDGKWDVLDTRQGLPSNQVFCFEEDAQGHLWTGTSEGVALFDGERFHLFEAQNELPHKEVRQLLWTKGSDGAPLLWLGPIRGGPCTWSDGKLVHHPIASKGVSALIPSHAGGVWVSFWGDGLSRWDGAHWQTWKQEDGLPSAQLRCLLEVKEDGRSVLWIGSDGRGVFRTAEGGWRQFRPPWSSEVEVRAFFEGSDGAAWIAGRNFGLLRWDGKAWLRWDLPSQPITGDVRCLAWWHGQLWAGCDLELTKLGPKGLQPGAPGTALDHRIIRCLAATPEVLWVGSSIGLYAWNGKTAELQRLPGGPGSVSVRSLALDANGLWVGTDGGLFRREGEGAFQAVPGFTPGEGILALSVVDKDLWIGTSAGRILRWRAGAMEVLAPAEEGRWAIQGLRFDAARSCLFASTTRGLECWDVGSRKLQHRYTMEDGLPDDTCTPGSLFADATGRTWVGTGNGAGVLDPLQPQTTVVSKPLHLAGAASASGPRLPGCLLPRGETWLDVSFALRAHHREEDTRYRTQLLPIETNPGEWSAESHRHLQGLPRGTYTLRIWGRDYQGQIASPVDFPFRVTGRFWEHPAFLFLVGLSLLGIGGFIMRARTLARERELVAAVTEATATLSMQKEGLEELARQQREIMAIVAHDIRNPLSGIGLMATLLEEELDPSEHQKGLRRIRGAVESVNDLLNQFLTLQALETGTIDLHLEPLDLSSLLQDVLRTYTPQAMQKRQTLHLDTSPARTVADPKILREVIGNLMSNALKYSPAETRVTVRMISVREGWLRITVQDEGPGLTEADKARLFQRFTRLSARPTGGEHSVGLGLSICKRWVEAMGGRIGVESEPGQGATFWVELSAAPENDGSH